MVQKWIDTARQIGFSEAASLDTVNLDARSDVRDMCAADKCGAYGKNWTCPPYCGTLEECAQRLHRYSHGIVVQTVGRLSKVIDTKGYRAAEKRHMELFHQFCDLIRNEHPDALCLGAGGCRLCDKCAWPDPCRFPERAVSSMEGYGLFVTQVCRDSAIAYHHGERTVTYTSCVLFGKNR